MKRNHSLPRTRWDREVARELGTCLWPAANVNIVIMSERLPQPDAGFHDKNIEQYLQGLAAAFGFSAAYYRSSDVV